MNACKHPYYAERYQHTKRRLGRQRGPKVAQIELARKLTEAIWHMLTRNQPFAPAGAPFSSSRLTAHFGHAPLESRESSRASGDGRLRQERVIRSRGSVPGYDRKRRLSPQPSRRARAASGGLPLGPRSESTGRHRRTPSPLLSRMETSALGVAAALPQTEQATVAGRTCRQHRSRGRPALPSMPSIKPFSRRCARRSSVAQ
jgi:hypothetical protein